MLQERKESNIIRKTKDKSRKRTMFMFVPLFLFLLLTPSCVYFNTFYNAQKYFESAQNQPLRDTGRPSPRAIQDYDKVIERCTYILAEHSNSRWADDALILLARSMYYKRQAPLQAKERFLDLLRVFPESKYVPQAHIYIAKIDFEMKDKREAHRRLQEVLDNQKFSDYHPEVLLLKSNYYLQDNDYIRAQEHLQQIIDRYPRSQQFELAFFTLGQAHLENGSYLESKEIFNILLNSRASRRTKLNSRYYIALNQYYLGEYEKALENVQRLIRLEYEASEFPRLNLLRARCLAGLSEYEEAESLFKSVIESNRRTLVSAEAAYYLAEMYFLQLFDYESAIKYYNQIQTEMRTSPFVEKGVSRSAVVSQLIQFSRTDRRISITELINEQFKLAEYYLYVMDMPDSALSVYSEIKNQETRLINQLDTLRAAKQESALLDEWETVSEIDSLDYTDETIAEQEATIDTLSTTEIEIKIRQLEEDIAQYRNEFLPYSLFAAAWIWLNVKNNEIKAQEILDELLTDFPENRYTYGTKSLLRGEKVEFVTPYETALERDYEEAVEFLQQDPPEAISLLQTIKEELDIIAADRPLSMSERLRDLQKKTLFSLGYAYYFHLADSSNARPYFDEIIEQEADSEYSRFISRFYQDNSFIVSEMLPSFKVEEGALEEDTKKEDETDYSKIDDREDFPIEDEFINYEEFGLPPDFSLPEDKGEER